MDKRNMITAWEWVCTAESKTKPEKEYTNW